MTSIHSPWPRWRRRTWSASSDRRTASPTAKAARRWMARGWNVQRCPRLPSLNWTRMSPRSVTRCTVPTCAVPSTDSSMKTPRPVFRSNKVTTTWTCLADGFAHARVPAAVALLQLLEAFGVHHHLSGSRSKARQSSNGVSSKLGSSQRRWSPTGFEPDLIRFNLLKRLFDGVPCHQ